MPDNFSDSAQETIVNDREQLVSTTDLKGVITYCNEAFCRIAEFSESELLGQNHNIVRHSDMPKAAFADMWANLKQGKAWRGIVKNRTKSGGFYWVDAYVTPIFDNGSMIGYQSVRVRPKREWVEVATKAYQGLIAAERGATRLSFSMPTSVRYALLAASLAAPAVAHLTELSDGITLAASLLPAGALGLFFRQELIDTPAQLNKLQSKFDSVSRLVYCGDSQFSVADFHLEMSSARIRTVLGRMTDSAKPLQTLADELSSTTEEVAQALTQQTADIHQVRDAADSMEQAANNVSSRSQDAHGLIDSTMATCVEAKSTLDETQQNLDTLRVQAEEATQMTFKLSEQAETVDSLMDEISGIADQTNLLALNAAIEAARAGEQGRGFAVVADEVRALSGRTSNATEQIKGSIETMLATIRSWQDDIIRNKEQTETCSSSAHVSAEKLADVEAMMVSMQELVTEVANSADNQLKLSSDVNMHIHSVASAAEENLAASSTVEQSSATLKNRVVDFYKLADQFSEKRI